jgi:hypothetical protein
MKKMRSKEGLAHPDLPGGKAIIPQNYLLIIKILFKLALCR